MATAEARHFHEIHELPVVFASRKPRRAFWSEVFENNHRIVKEPKDGQRVVVVENYPGRRPYILETTPERYIYNHNFFIEPGELFLSEEERTCGITGAVIVEPHTKQDLGFSRNKAWPWERWQSLVEMINLPWLQLGPKGTRRLEGVTYMETPRFRDALGYVNACSFVVTTDGALHHAAAALGKDAVVLWGGASDPDIAGYRTHRNIRADIETCGSIGDCEHCREAMSAITVDMVANEVLRLSKREKASGILA